MRRFVPELLTGVLATLIGDPLARYALHLSPGWHWLLVAGVGVAAAATTALVRAPGGSRVTRILTKVRARRAMVKDLRYRDDGSGDLSVLKDVKVEGDLDINGLHVDRGGGQDG